MPKSSSSVESAVQSTAYPRPNARLLAPPIALSCVVLLAGCFAVAPVRDAATLTSATGVSLDRADAYVAFAPFSDVLDTITLLSERQDIAVMLGLLVLWCLWRFARPNRRRQSWHESLRSFAVLLVSIALAYTAAVYLPRPMAYLTAEDKDVLRIDFHSHTQRSKDARQSYSVERNREWHFAGGFDVAYITDHHAFAAGEHGALSDLPLGKDGVILLRGIEVTWQHEHVGLLGEEQTDRCVLSADLHDVDLRSTTVLGCCGARTPLAIWNHPRDPKLENLPVASGSLQAIEISNGAIHGMDLVRSKRQPILALARKDHLALVSGTDSHGWGYVVPNWTLLRLKGWRQLDRETLATQIEQTLRTRGFDATRVIERATVDPGASTMALALTVVTAPWWMLRELSTNERWMWLVWIWGITGIAALLFSPRPLARHRVAVAPTR